MREHPKASHYFLGKNVEDITMGNPQEERDAAIWLAAMILGEGSINLYPQMNWSRGKGKSRRKTPVRLVNCSVVINNTDQAIMDEVARYCKILGAGEYRYEYKREGVGYGVKPLTVIRINGFKRLARFLPQVIPFLVGEKQYKAILVLGLCQERALVPAGTPYTEDQIHLINTLCPGKRHQSSSEANAPGMDNKSMMIESDPIAKVMGGESVSKYPATSGVV